MSNLLILLLSAVVATNQPMAASSRVPKTTRAPAKVAAPNDSVEKAYGKLLAEDDAAQKEADKWIRDADAFTAKGGGLPRAALTAKIEQRFELVRKSYMDFLARHPDHTRARLAYGSFLNDIQEEEKAVVQWEKARELDPTNPAAWNNLANHYGHRGPVKKAFEYYTKAIELDPEEPVYLQNLATTTYLFRKDAKEFYQIDEQQVFDRALDLYRKALQLDPNNFPLATDLAQSYYGIKPLRTDDAIAAWNKALKVASDDIEREGVYLHLARVELNSGLYEEARKHLNMGTNAMYTALKNRLLKNLTEKEKGTNAPSAASAQQK